MITPHIERPNGIEISIPFMGVEKRESSWSQAIRLSVFECIVIDPFFVVIQSTGYFTEQETYHYGLTKSLTVENKIFPGSNDQLSVSASSVCILKVEPLGGDSRHCRRLFYTFVRFVYSSRAKRGGDPQTDRLKTDEVNDLGLFSPKSKCHDQDCQN
jgi:hypothetical protein